MAPSYLLDTCPTKSRPGGGALAVEAHECTVARIFPRIGETGTTEEVVALLAATR